MWKSESPIWEELKKTGEEFPKFEETALPGNMVFTDQQAASQTSNEDISKGKNPF